MNHGETVSVPSPYEGCTELTGEVSVVFFFFSFAQDASKIYA